MSPVVKNVDPREAQGPAVLLQNFDTAEDAIQAAANLVARGWILANCETQSDNSVNVWMFRPGLPPTAATTTYPPITGEKLN